MPRASLFSFRRLFAASALSLLFAIGAYAQGSVTDGSTPLALSPGAPAGSYSLSGFDNVNLYNGSLNFSLPLLKVGSRGEAGYTITLPIEQHWTVKHTGNPELGALHDFPQYNSWNGMLPGYSPGTLQGRQVNDQLCAQHLSVTSSLTRLTFTTPDGTEYEMVDQSSGGQPLTSYCSSSNGAPRGTVFVTTDGTAMTFISDSIIYDSKSSTGSAPIYPSGLLLSRNGIRYRIDNGTVSWIRDRNGNQMTFATVNGVYTITDSLNRQVTVAPVNDPTYGTCDKITYNGFGGTPRSIYVAHSSLANVLRNTQSYDVTTAQTNQQLFPQLNYADSTTNNPSVVSAVWLPDGQGYHFFYNPYGELARVVLPTGGAFEYDYGAGEVNGAASGVIQVSGSSGTGSNEIYRRVVARRVYANGSTLEGQMAYSRPEDNVGNNAGYVSTDHLNPSNTLIARENHYFYNKATSSFNQSPLGYPGWKDGREYQTDAVNPSDGTTVLRRVTLVWQQAPGGGTADTSKPYNPRVVEADTTLADVSPNLVSKQTYSYDQFNNKTDTWEYDFGSGGAPAYATRHTHVDYLTTNPANGIDYTGTGYSLRSLPTAQRVYSVNPQTGAESPSPVAQSTTAYDESAYPLLPCDPNLVIPCTSVPQWVDPGTSVRGDATTTSRWLDTANTWLSAHAQYDQLGNVRNTWDANNNETQVTYSDSFSDGNNSRNTYAFLTHSTSAVPDPTNNYGSNVALTASRVYDYSTGLVTSATDANGQTTTAQYGDSLGRLTQVSYPDGGQTTYTYVDAHQCGPYVETHTLLDTAGRQTDSFQFFDGLGRPYRSFAYENQDTNNPYLTADTQYDAMGRAYRVSNPYRTAGCTSAVNPSGQWTTTGYDALGRPTSVTTPDSAVISTSYSGKSVTMTDQRGNKRSSVSDALGRLTQVTEDPTSGGYNYQTTYGYDALGNLLTVSQGAQTRTFAYDSLSRLKSATNPESGTVNYTYDAAGNLQTKTDARGVTAHYGYDALNRNTTVSYTNDPANTPPVTRAYDGLSGGSQLIPNGLGRPWYSVTTGTTGSLTAVDRYDQMGRVTAQHQRFAVASDPGGGAYWLNQWWSAAYNVTRSYDKAGHVLTETYPSGHSVTYNYDIAGRLADNSAQQNPAAFYGTLGDGVQRTYATQVSYSTFGSIQQEQFGTQTALFRKLHYNVRGQLYDQRLGKLPWATDQWDWSGGGAFINFYATADLNATTNEARANSGPDNNGNLRQEDTFVQTDPNGTYNASTAGAYFVTVQGYGYDSLNRLTSVSESNYSTALGAWGTPLSQGYHYDQWGNRTIDTNQTSGAPNTQFDGSDLANTNRLYAPGDSAYSDPNDPHRRMRYDAAGNLVYDGYTGNGSRGYDANNRMVTASDSYGGTSTYTYDADGQRVRRANMYGETWQVYGVGGELLAEYASTAAVYLPQKEYGYRNGQLLVTMTSGNSQRLTQFVTNLYYGALQRDPTSSELQSGVNQLAAAGAQGESQLQTSAAQLARSLFTSTSYETSPYRTDSQFVADLYNTYLQRGPDTSGWNWWTAQVPSSGRANICNAFEASSEFQALVASLYGTATSDSQRTGSFVNNFFLGANGSNASPSDFQTYSNSLNTAAALGLSNVQSAAQQMGQAVFTPQLTDTTISDQQFVTNLYEAFLQRGPDTSGLNFWTSNAAGGSANRQNVLNAFKGCTAFQQLSGTLYRETFWLVPDHLGTPRMVADKGGSLSGIKRHDYLPFGEELSANMGGRTTTQGYSAIDDVRQKFTSQERDSETLLDYMGARYYSSQQGRFSGADSFAGSAGDPQTWNLYSYVQNKPLTLTDPTGHYSLDPEHGRDIPWSVAGEQQQAIGTKGNLPITGTQGKVTPAPSQPTVDPSKDPLIVNGLANIRANGKPLSQGEKPVLTNIIAIPGTLTQLKNGKLYDGYGSVMSKSFTGAVQPVAYVPVDQNGNPMPQGSNLWLTEDVKTVSGEEPITSPPAPQNKDGIFIDIQTASPDLKPTVLNQSIEVYQDPNAYDERRNSFKQYSSAVIIGPALGEPNVITKNGGGKPIDIKLGKPWQP
jgi:RHS repeat-associated protein